MAKSVEQVLGWVGLRASAESVWTCQPRPKCRAVGLVGMCCTKARKVAPHMLGHWVSNLYWLWNAPTHPDGLHAQPLHHSHCTTAAEHHAELPLDIWGRMSGLGVHSQLLSGHSPLPCLPSVFIPCDTNQTGHQADCAFCQVLIIRPLLEIRWPCTHRRRLCLL